MPVPNWSLTSGEARSDRIKALETALQADEALSLATHFYAGGYVPTALTSGTDTAGINGQVWISEIRIPVNVTLTGISFLLGSVGGTDKVIVSLYDSKGNVLATSAVAGVTAGTLATFQRVAFTAPITLAPGLYYVGVQTNGTTAKLRTQAAGDHNTGVASQTFGTPVAITPPASFTAANGPIAMTY
jgi:hypothetical protein